MKLAREIAIDHRDIGDILKIHQISLEAWEIIKQNPRFTAYLKAEIEAWESALNTAERTQLKAAAVVEEWLPEASAIIHNRQESLAGRAEIAKLLARLAGFGLTGAGVDGSGGEKFVFNINIGAGLIKIEKTLPPRVIEGAVLKET